MMVYMRVIGLAILGALAGCENTETERQDSIDGAAPIVDSGAQDSATPEPPEPASQVLLIRLLSFAREDDGITVGFDLDESITEQGGDTGCGHPDFTTEAGLDGVDNQFSQLLPLIEQFGGMAIESYGQGAINSGNLLLMIELSGIDNWQTDDEVSVTIYRGLGEPLMGADERLSAWQTFDIDPNTPSLITREAFIEDAVLKVRDLDFTFPFYIFDFVFEITLQEARLEFELTETAQNAGTLAGSITIENMLQIADNIEGGDMLPGLIRGVGTTLADMKPDGDGVCQALSTTMVFETVGAFIYEDSARPEEP